MEQVVCPRCGEPVEFTSAMRTQVEGHVRRELEVAYEARLRDSRERIEREIERREATRIRQLREKEEELSAAQKQVEDLAAEHAALRRRQRELEEERRLADLDVERRVAEAAERVRRDASAEFQERLRREVAEAVRSKDEEVATLRRSVSEMADREAGLLRREREIAAREQQVQLELERRLAQEMERSRTVMMAQFEERLQRQIAEARRATDEELAEARKRLAGVADREAEIARARRAMEEEKERLGVELEQRLAEEVRQARIRTEEDVRARIGNERRIEAEEYRLKIEQLNSQVEVLQRRLRQGSQQLQGEAQEIALRELLARSFPGDDIRDVPAGAEGADVLQAVYDGAARECGLIVWESKRTKAWSDQWLPKLRDDQRALGAACAVLVSQALPDGIRTFALRDGVYVCGWDYAQPLAAVLRAGLIDVAMVRRADEGRTDKMSRLYDYLTGPDFRNRMAGVVEAFVQMKEELAQEQRALQRIWRRRGRQLERALQNLAGVYGDIEGISGKSLEGMDALALPDGRSGVGEDTLDEPTDEDLSDESDRDVALAELLFELIPATGENIGNRSLFEEFFSAALERLGEAVYQEDYDRCKDLLLRQGRIRRGAGRGGSVARIPTRSRQPV